MTANQIANTATQESIRHNQASEEEIERHNQASEVISEDANNIQRIYNERKLDLEEWYNKAYIEYLNASSERKLEIEQQLADIKQQQNDLGDWYEQQMAGIENRKMTLAEELEPGKLELSMEDFWLREKQAYYQNQLTEAQTANIYKQWELSERNLINQATKIQNEYQLGLIDANTRQQQILNQIHEFQFDMAKWQTVGYSMTMQELQNLKASNLEIYSRVAKNLSSIASDWTDALLPF